MDNNSRSEYPGSVCRFDMKYAIRLSMGSSNVRLNLYNKGNLRTYDDPLLRFVGLATKFSHIRMVFYSSVRFDIS